MELLQLRYFLTAAKLQHMTHAAESLGIAQPALSQSIKRLEEEFSVRLFDRTRRTITLTPEGALLAKRLQPILSALDAIPGELREFHAERDHVIHLTLDAASSMITSCIIAYKTLHPDISFQLSQITRSSSLSDIYISTALSDDRIAPEQESILQENFFLAVPRNSRYAEQDSVNLLDTVHEGFISLSESKPVRSICDYFCLAAGFAPHIIFESDSLEAVRNLISAGLGIGFWPEYSWGELPKKEVKLLRVEKVDCRRDIIVTITDQGREKQAVADFHDFLLEYTRDLVKR